MSEAVDRNGEQEARRSPLSRNRDYLLVWTGGAVSLLGSELSVVAYPLLALTMTGSATQAGLIGTFALLGRVIFRLPAGALVDRWDRRKTMLASDALRGAIMVAVAVALVADRLTFQQLVIAAFCENALGEVFRPAATAAVRRVVDPAQMPEVISKSEARSFGAMVAGPPLGGLLYSVAVYLPFVGDALSYAYSFISTLFVRTPLRPQIPESAGPVGLFEQLTGGLRWIWAHRPIRCMILSAAGFNFVFAGLFLTVVVAARSSGATSGQIGIMLGMASAGGFVGSFVAVRLASYRRPSRLLLTIMWTTAAVIPVMAIDQNPYILGALLALTLVLAPTANTIIVSLQVARTPDHFQGRVDAAGEFIATSASPAAPLIAGILITAVGSPTTLVITGLAMLFIALVTSVSRTMRTIPALMPR